MKHPTTNYKGEPITYQEFNFENCNLNKLTVLSTDKNLLENALWVAKTVCERTNLTEKMFETCGAYYDNEQKKAFCPTDCNHLKK